MRPFEATNGTAVKMGIRASLPLSVCERGEQASSRINPTLDQIEAALAQCNGDPIKAAEVCGCRPDHVVRLKDMMDRAEKIQEVERASQDITRRRNVMAEKLRKVRTYYALIRSGMSERDAAWVAGTTPRQVEHIKALAADRKRYPRVPLELQA